MVHRAAQLFGHQGLQVSVGELDLAVGQFLEPGEGRVEHVTVDVDAHLGQGVLEGGPPRVLAQYQLRPLLAHRHGVHDLVGGGLVEHPVLMDACFVGEGVATHYGLVVLHRVAG